jgi:hypothetical protein
VFTVVFGLLLAACSDSSDNGDDPAPTPSPSPDNKPAILPDDWKTRDYDGWEKWYKDLDQSSITAEDLQSVLSFIKEHFAELTEGGKEYWSDESGLVDISNWPQERDKNSPEVSLYFRKSSDGQALACNPMGRGDGTNYIPNIFILQEAGKGAFPIGTWKESGKSLTFTDTTVTFRIPNNSSVGWTAAYTISDSGDTFVLSNLTRP